MFEITRNADQPARNLPRLETLPGDFAVPSGYLLPARLDGSTVGCVGFRATDAGMMEVRRILVRPDARGLGVGARLLARLVSEARQWL